MTSAAIAQFPALVCPLDHQALIADVAGRSLACPAGHAFSVRENIPRLLPSGQNYADAFGEQWHQYRRTQLDSCTGTTYSRDRLRRCFGEVLWQRLQQPVPLQILEAGCGAGRFTEVLLGTPAAAVTSTDLSAAVEPNQLNCPQSPRHRIAQCDINQLPFLPGQFDVVMCLGVIQHTRDPERTIADLYRQVKPGGWLVIDHYRHAVSTYTKITVALMRPILKRLPPKQGIAATKTLTQWFFPLHRAVRRHKALQVILSRVSPIITYFHVLPKLSDALQYEWSELDTHDALTDWYKRLRSRRSIRRTLEKLGVVELWVERGGNGIEARGRKPVA
ncbi:MAG: methyltransferase domain-containing protein [Steroidobacteraceae bacterium]